MASDITFPDSVPEYVFDRDCLAFRARVGDGSVLCLVTAELLFSRFGAKTFTEDALREAFQNHRPELEEIARTHIESGWVDEERRIVLTTRFTNLTVRNDPSLGLVRDGLATAASAHRTLLGIVGPSAEAVGVTWSAAPGPESPGVTVRITDPVTGFSATGLLGPREADPVALSLRLSLTWGSVLRERSRRLAIKIG